MLTEAVIRQLSLSRSITSPCTAQVRPPINLQKVTGANSVALHCRAMLLTDRSACLWVVSDKLRKAEQPFPVLGFCTCLTPWSTWHVQEEDIIMLRLSPQWGLWGKIQCIYSISELDWFPVSFYKFIFPYKFIHPVQSCQGLTFYWTKRWFRWVAAMLCTLSLCLRFAPDGAWDTQHLMSTC